MNPDCPLIDTVWIARRPGDSRRYASPTPFSPEFCASLHAEGFLVIRVDYEVPRALWAADVAARGKVTV